MAIILWAGCLVPGESPFEAIESDPPTVVATNPHDGVDNVPVKVEIDLTFSERLDPASLPAAAVQVVSGGEVASGVIGFDRAGANLYSFVPLEPLLAGVTYDVTVSGEVTDVFYNPMGEDFTFQFTTSVNPDPFVVDFVDPDDQAVDVPVDAVVTVSFSRPVEPADVRVQNFALRNETLRLVSRVVELTPGGSDVTITPREPLDPAAVYSLTVAGTVKDVSGQRLGFDHVSTFTTLP